MSEFFLVLLSTVPAAPTGRPFGGWYCTTIVSSLGAGPVSARSWSSGMPPGVTPRNFWSRLRAITSARKASGTANTSASPVPQFHGLQNGSGPSFDPLRMGV